MPRPDDVLALQRSVGNHLVSQLLQHGGPLPVQREPAYGVGVEGSGEKSLIHRTEPAEGAGPDTVRCYLTVFARSEPAPEEHNGRRHKDIHTENGKVVFINKSEDTMLNMGDPRRAFHYIRTYTNQQAPAEVPIIRSFEIPRTLYGEVTGAAISEAQRGKLGKDKPYNVDKERGQNQFGLPPAARDRIEAAGTNLISYVAAEHVDALKEDSSNGQVKEIDELLAAQLGMPDKDHRQYLVPMRGGHVPTPREEAAHGGNLTRFYDDLDDLVGAMEGTGRNPAHNVYAFQIRPSCGRASSGYYGDVVAPLVAAEGYLPARKVEEVKNLREQIGRAATFSVIPQMVTEEYLQANARLHGQARDKNMDELSSWAQSQTYGVVSMPQVTKEPKKKGGGTPEDWERARALKRAEKAKEVAQPEDDSATFDLGDLFAPDSDDADRS